MTARLLLSITVISLFALNSCKKESSTPPPVASFTVKSEAIEHDFVQFNSTSTGETSLLWNFGDGATSTDKSTGHIYSKFGDYTVTLTASNAGGSNQATKIIHIKRAWPIAKFTCTNPHYFNQIITFTSQSENADSLAWDFGDGNYATGKTAGHTFPLPGNFVVSLTASNSSGTDIYKKAVVVPEGTADYDVSNFSSIGAILYSYYWNGTDIVDFTNHGYVAPGETTQPFYTTHDQMYLGGQVNNTNFVCVFPFPIKSNRLNHLILHDTTLVYFGHKGRAVSKDMILNINELLHLSPSAALHFFLFEQFPIHPKNK